jgi:hypothetical protein
MANGKYDLGNLLKEIEKTKGAKESDDSKSVFWKPTLDKDQERAEYIIRFLPNTDSVNGMPWIERRAHMFKFASGKFMYEPCPKKAGKGECFACEEVAKLYATKEQDQMEIGGKRFAKQRFFMNVLVVKDPRENGKNEGKIMVYEFGDQIHNKCLSFLSCAEIEPEERVFFHPTMGTNFNLVIKWKKDYQNYDDADFARKTSAIKIDNKVLSLEEAEEFIEKNSYKLNEKLLDSKCFKTYEDIKSTYLNQGNKKTERTKARTETTGTEVGEDNELVPDFLKPTPKAEPEVKVATKKVDPPKITPKKEEDEDLPFDAASSNDNEDAELEALLK